MIRLPSQQEFESKIRPWFEPYDPTGVIPHLAEYLELTEEGVRGFVYGRDPKKPLADLWMECNPRSKEDFRAYYSAETGYYLWDLAAFNTSMPYWFLKVDKALAFGGKIVDFGGGIGSLSIALARIGADVCYVDLPSPQRRFAEWRFKKLGLSIKVCGSLKEIDWADTIVAIDVLEHLHPEELGEVCREFARLLPRGSRGEVLAITEFWQSAEWPMHQENGQLFGRCMRGVGFEPSGSQKHVPSKAEGGIWVRV